MQTQVMDDRILGVPWLESYPAEGGSAVRTELTVFPFKIGRVETADLQIDDARVSREHAVILREGNTFLVHDLGSTNGTILNGRRVREAPLNDGDILVIADVEFGFNCGQPSAQATATQVMSDVRGEPSADGAWNAVRAVRRVHEMLAQRSVDLRFQPIVAFDSGDVFGYAALAREDDPLVEQSSAERRLLNNAGRLGGRLRELSRRVAVESARALPADCRVFLRLDASEIGCDGLLDALIDLRDAANADGRLVVETPESAVGDLPYFHEFNRRLRDNGVDVAYYGFAGGKAQLHEKRRLPPDYLKLAPAVVTELECNDARQRQMQEVVVAARELNCRIVAEGVDTDAQASVCQKLGIAFGQGPKFGSPQPITLLRGDNTD